MTPAAEKTSLTLSGLPPVNALICYEGIFPEISRAALQAQGSTPEWILNLSNDGWYGRLTGPYQHANQARYRAIETGLPLVRASAGGESGVYDAYGRRIIVQPVRVTGVLDVALPNQSVHNAQLFKPIWFLLLITLSILVMSILWGRGQTNSTLIIGDTERQIS